MGSSFQSFQPGRGITKLRAVWSNGQSIKEYQDFLSGKGPPAEQDDGPSLIIAPRERSALVDTLVKLGGGEDSIIHPGDPLPSSVRGRDSFPVYVAVPASQLDSLLPHCESKRDDLVFFTRGDCLESVLKKHALLRDATTQILVSFSTPGGERFPSDLCVEYGTDARDEPKLAFPTATCGKWKDGVAKRIERGDIRVDRLFYRDWRRRQWEQIVFESCFQLVGAVREEPTTIQDVGRYYAEDVEEMAWQLMGMLRGSDAVSVMYGFEERMFAFAEARGEMRCGLESFPFRNGIFLEKSFAGNKIGFGDPAPLHTEYLGFAVNDKGLLPGVDIPDFATQDLKEGIMRKGNLRADGVI